MAYFDSGLYGRSAVCMDFITLLLHIFELLVNGVYWSRVVSQIVDGKWNIQFLRKQFTFGQNNPYSRWNACFHRKLSCLVGTNPGQVIRLKFSNIKLLLDFHQTVSTSDMVLLAERLTVFRSTNDLPYASAPRWALCGLTGWLNVIGLSNPRWNNLKVWRSFVFY